MITTGGSYADSFNLNIRFAFYINNCFPQVTNSLAYFFIKTNADNVVYEGANGNNNVTGTGIRVLINPLVDHIVTNVTGPDMKLLPGPLQPPGRLRTWAIIQALNTIMAGMMPYTFLPIPFVTAMIYSLLIIRRILH